MLWVVLWVVQWLSQEQQVALQFGRRDQTVKVRTLKLTDSQIP